MKKAPKTLTTLTLALLALTQSARGNLFDTRPFCWAPDLFPGQMKQYTSKAGFNAPEDLNGNWYTLGFRKQPWNTCPCLIQSYKWSPEKTKYRAWYGCINELGDWYTNVVMYPGNAGFTKFSAYMRFSKNGFFWLGFEYYFIEVAEDRSWFLAADPCKSMAFLMSRTMKIEEGVYQGIVRRVKEVYGIENKDFVPLCQTYDGR